MKIIFLFLFFIFQIVKLRRIKNYDIGTLFYKLIREKKIIEPKDDYLFEYCLSKNKTLTDNIVELFFYTGKYLGQRGDINSCEKKKFTSFLYWVEKDPKTFNSTDYGQIQSFIDHKTYFIGFCLPNYCIKCFNILMNQKSGIFKELRRDYSNQSIMLKRVDLEKYEDLKNDSFVDKSVETKYSKVFTYFNYSITIYICFVIICSFIKIVFFFSLSLNEEEIKKKYDEEEDEEEEEEEEEDEFNILINKYINGERDSYNENLLFKKNIPTLENEKNPLIKILKQFLSFFDIFNNLYLFMSSNICSNNTSIEIIGFIRIILMFGIIFGKTYIIQITTFIQRDYFDENFYNKIFFIFIKLTVYINIAWIILDGTIFGFKLMSYLKEIIKKNKYLSFSMYIKFYKYLIPKIICFLFIYFFFDIMISNFSKENILLDYYIKVKINRLECYNSPFKIFHPLFFYKNQNQTISTEHTLNNYEKCYEYTNIFINEFYGIILLSLILYLSLLFQSKKFDLIITFLLLINLFTIPLINNRGFDQYEKFYINLFLGQKFTEQYFHLFISIFFLGFLIGLIFFHYHDSINSNFGIEYYNFTPFSFTQNIIKILNIIQPLYKKIFVIILIVLIFILALPIYIYNNKFGLKIEKDDDKKIIQILKLFDDYEKSVFAIIFSILLILLKIITENSYFLNYEIIGTFERMKLSFYCSIELFLNLANTILEIHQIISYQNIFSISVGYFIVSYIFNYIFNILFILPFEKLIKRKRINEMDLIKIHLLNSIGKHE